MWDKKRKTKGREKKKIHRPIQKVHGKGREEKAAGKGEKETITVNKGKKKTARLLIHFILLMFLPRAAAMLLRAVCKKSGMYQGSPGPPRSFSVLSGLSSILS